MSNCSTGSNPTAPGPAAPVTSTFTVVRTERAPRFSCADTVTCVGPSPSDIRAGSAESTIRSEASSSSASTTVVGVTGRLDRPVTSIVSSVSSTWSGSGVNVNVPVPDSSRALIVNAMSKTDSKSTASGPSIPLTEVEPGEHFYPYTVNSPMWISGALKRPPRLAPWIGQHTNEVLAEIGFSEGEVEQMIADGIALQRGDA